MYNFILTQSSVPIIGWFAKMLGYVMQWLYVLFSNFDIRNIGLCIIIFTLIMKLLLFPLTIKQQKFSKLSSLMNPELQELQKKYKGKTDTESRLKMNEEMQAVYQKYGTSPTGGCLQILIQMPILFSLYYIVSNVPAYVPQVEKLYQPISDSIVSDYDYFKYMNKAYDDYVMEDNNDEYKYIDNMLDSFGKIKEKNVIDSLAKYTKSQWTDLRASYEHADEFIDEVSKVSDEDWATIIDDIKDESTKEEIEKFVEKLKTDESKDEILSGDTNIIEKSHKDIEEVNEFGPIDLSQSPKAMMGISLLIPLLSFLSQWYSSKLAMASNADQMKDNPMGNSMKVMNIVLPLFSAFIAFTVPAGLGLYWACNGIFQIIQQICIDQYFKKVDINDIIKSNVEKQNKRKERMGIDVNRVYNAASTNTKSINKNTNNKKNVNLSQNHKYKQGSMAAKANMVKEFNEKNGK